MSTNTAVSPTVSFDMVRTSITFAFQPIPQGPSDVAVGIPANVLRQRPDVRAAESNLAAAILVEPFGQCADAAKRGLQIVSRDVGKIA